MDSADKVAALLHALTAAERDECADGTARRFLRAEKGIVVAVRLEAILWSTAVMIIAWQCTGIRTAMRWTMRWAKICAADCGLP